MNLIELNRALRQLRLGGMAAVLETRLRQAQAESMAPRRNCRKARFSSIRFIASPLSKLS